MRCCPVSYQEERSVAVACGLFQVGERLVAKRSAGDVERERHRQVVLYIHQQAQVGAENLSHPRLKLWDWRPQMFIHETSVFKHISWGRVAFYVRVFFFTPRLM